MRRGGKDKEPNFGLDSMFKEAARLAGITHARAVKDFVKYANKDAKRDGWTGTATMGMSQLKDLASWWWSENQSKYQ